MKRILYVEDEDLLRKILSDRLCSEFSVSVLTASSGNEAIALLRAGERVDLIISDLDMPNGTGLDLLKHLSGARSEVPILLYTGRVSPEVERLTDTHFLGIVEKPNHKRLFKAVAVALGDGY